jgi:pimeloyl-ACP methyl ester carboxylesterase
VVAFDLRGHGRSDDGLFDPEIAFQDLQAVVSAFSMRRPAVIGHSLGGVIATIHASSHHTRAVVNIDGGSSLRNELYPGLDESAIAAFRERHQARGDRSRGVGGILDTGDVEARADQLRQLLPGELREASFRRNLREVAPGQFVVRPSSEVRDSARSILTLEILDLYEQLDQPLLVYVNVGLRGISTMFTTEEQDDLATYATYRQRLGDQLVGLAARLPKMQVQETTEGHDFFWMDPAKVGNQIAEFLSPLD